MSDGGHTALKGIACRGVGDSGPAASTPEKALTAFLDQNGVDGSGWKRVGHDVFEADPANRTPQYDEYSLAPEHGNSGLRRGANLEVISIVVGNETGSWKVVGACV